MTEQDAYWIGFLLADGCVYQPPGNRQRWLTVNLKGSDMHHLEKMAGFLGGRTYKQKNGSGYYRLSSNDVCDWVESYGVVPRKTGKEEAHPELSNNRHFWRGVVDGDGCLRIRKSRQRYKTTMYEYDVPVLKMCGSERICTQFGDFLGWNTSKVKKDPRAKCFSIVKEGGKAVPRAVKYLYQGSVEHLDRKKEKAQEVLELWPV